MDLSELTPAPWTPAVETERGYKGDEFGRFWIPTFQEMPFGWAAELEDQAKIDAQFIAMARNAFDGDPEALAWWEKNRKRRTP